jgi:predicted RND superfamily exporter protein
MNAGRRRRQAIDRLAAFLIRRAKGVVLMSAILAAIAGIVSWRHLGLNADTDALIGEGQPYMRAYRQFKRDFGDLEYLIVVVDPRGDEAAADEAVRSLVRRLSTLPGSPAVHGVIDARDQHRVGTWSMDDERLEALHAARGALPVLAADPGAGGLLQAGTERLQTLLERGAGMGSVERRQTAAEALLLLRCALGGMQDPAPSLADPLPDRWLMADGGRLRLVLVQPLKDYATLAVIEEPLRRIRAVMSQVQREHPSVEIGLTGKPVLQADEMASTERDMRWASAVAMVLCSLLFMVVFRGIKRPLLAVAAFVMAAAVTSGVAALTVGRLNLLSVVFMLVLVGVGLDYGIHMVARYLEGLRHLGPQASVRHMMRKALPSVLSGAVTSVGVFLLAMLVPMQGLRELGWISGAGLAICAVAMGVTLPALLLWLDRRAAREPLGRGLFEEPLAGRQDPWDGRASARHALILAASVALVVASVWLAWGGVRFESNLLRLQADGLDSVGWQRRLQQEGGNATWFGACIVPELEAVPAVLERASREPLIGRVRSVLDVIRMDTPRRAAWRRDIAATAEAPAAAVRQIATPQMGAEASRTLGQLADGARLSGAGADAVAELEAMRERMNAFRSALAAQQDATVRAAMAAASRASVAAAALLEGAKGSLHEALPAAVRDSFTSEQGAFAVMLHPVEDVWEFQAMDRFVGSMRRVDPHVTGAPITVSESMKLMERSFLMQGVMAAAFVFAVLLADYRSLRLSAISMACLLGGLACTVGLMAVLDIAFNLANFFAMPVMIGLSVDSCIHVTHRAVDGGLRTGFGSTRRAVVVTALTTTIGFGTLVMAEHQGLRSLGQVMAIASLSCLAFTAWTLPAALRLLGVGRGPSPAPTVDT